jgi:hypothetical protein
MAEVKIIQFTQDQARNITGISGETLRHWRKNIPYLAEKSGKSARFSYSDIVCLAATAQIIKTFGISIGAIGPTLDPVFRKLAELRASLLSNHAILIKESDALICRIDDIAGLDISAPLLVIPLAPLMVNLRDSLLPGFFSEPQRQRQIPFAPQTING